MTTETNTQMIVTPSSDDKNIATITHLCGVLFSLIPALIVWILAQIVAGVLVFILIGFLFIFIIWVINIVFCIIAAISTSKGENYRYPLTLRLIN